MERSISGVAAGVGGRIIDCGVSSAQKEKEEEPWEKVATHGNVRASLLLLLFRLLFL